MNRLGESELRISQVTKADSGNYTCQPANTRPASISLHIITGEEAFCSPIIVADLLTIRAFTGTLNQKSITQVGLGDILNEHCGSCCPDSFPSAVYTQSP